MSTLQKKVNYIDAVIIALIIILAAIPREISIFVFSDGANRQYGSSISISLSFIISLLLLYKGKIKNDFKLLKYEPFFQYLLFGLLYGLFGALIQMNIKFYFVGAYRYILYIVLYIFITSNISFESIHKGFEIGLKVGCLFQAFVGLLRVFTGYLIPFISGTSENKRDGMLRLVGTFQHPGDCSLYLSFALMFFLCAFFYTRKKKTNLLFFIITFITIYYTQARAILIISFITISIIIFIKFRKKILVKLLLIPLVIFVLYCFYNSDIYYELFIRNSFTEMLYARSVHWIIGGRIMIDNPVNFFIGVGLNGIVDYINTNYYDFADLVLTSTVLDESFVRGMPIHNSILIVGCELGIVGLILYIRFFIKYIVFLIKAFLNSKYKFQPLFVSMSLVSFLIYCIQGWAAHKNFAWTMLVLLFAYVYLF